MIITVHDYSVMYSFLNFYNNLFVHIFRQLHFLNNANDFISITLPFDLLDAENATSRSLSSRDSRFTLRVYRQ